MDTRLNIGIDIGSTTVKAVVLRGETVVFEQYQRHFSQVRQAALELLSQAQSVIGEQPFGISLSGSAALGLAEDIGLPFVQEVLATQHAVRKLKPDTDVVIELGGEDAKILFLTGGSEERMNGTCAGGTGAFIDQMATLLDVTTAQLDALALAHTRIYPIASRCGVFAKTDVQPLLNQGAKKEDIAASIFQAVVEQTITGLAQGRRIQGNLLFLGGPLHFFSGLRERFVETLKPKQACFPDYALLTVAIGAAMHAATLKQTFSFEEIHARLAGSSGSHAPISSLAPLFESETDYDAFLKRHAKDNVPFVDIGSYQGGAYLGVDCGSTTTKLILMDENGRILYHFYNSNKGNPVEIVREQLIKIQGLLGDRIAIRGAASTGYGEDLIKNAFCLDGGVVETIAHFKAARHFNPAVNFILDIGGQDIKCFKIKDNAIDSIMLNEACSSGCGSFLETFARSMGYDVESFSKLGLFARHPVNLGSRCTVFMNSSVKQAQKDGACVEDISAGLSTSIVKNVIYKVIRAKNKEEFGKNIVVQGGTFLNDAVLRSFELEIDRHVIRPNIAGLMGAYGAALYAKELQLPVSSCLNLRQLSSFTHSSAPLVCKGCANHCNLTVNTFSEGKRFLSGNRCEKPLGLEKRAALPDLYEYKLEKIKRLAQMHPKDAPRGKIGIPLGLNTYETAYFWHAFFSSLGFDVILSDLSTRKLYSQGQYSIPSDTVCYPAKLMHGHVENLLEKGLDTIFYPCMSYNIDEKKGDNHFNCPVVAYYPELLRSNVDSLRDVRYLSPFLDLNVKRPFVKNAFDYLKGYYRDLTLSEVRAAASAGYESYRANLQDNIDEGLRGIETARKMGAKIIILAGRPYHIDPEINHGINKLITSLGLAVISEDCVAQLASPAKVNVLNQWTYHARLYNSATYVTQNADMNLVQLVSFGCGIDAITTDETAAILAAGGKLYTQLKIDEINNLGAVKIRLRSLLGAIEERGR